jgi:hypothetical protein
MCFNVFNFSTVLGYSHHYFNYNTKLKTKPMFGFNFIPNSPVKNLERMLVHVGLEYGKYVSGISPSCIILSVSQTRHLFFPSKIKNENVKKQIEKLINKLIYLNTKLTSNNILFQNFQKKIKLKYLNSKR